MNSHQTGKLAELIARIFMRLKGYSIIKQNFITGKGTHAGEVDFIAKKRRTIVFVEVKKRKNLDTAAYSIFESQKLRIRRGAESFLKQNPQYSGLNYRFDAILIQLPLKIKHIKNAF